MVPAASQAPLDDTPLREARQQLEQLFDPNYGGFGPAPKFPQVSSLERCLRHWHGTSRDTQPDLKALYMATLSLTRMAEGGLFDQLGGGFSRYSVDEAWMIPHFEKMLYDNGQLLQMYAWATVATGEPLFGRAAAETAEWALRDMRSPEGGFYSSLDADSEGHEGKFYVWDRAEVRTLLTPEEYALMAARFGLDGEPNFEGRYHLHAFAPLDAVPPDPRGPTRRNRPRPSVAPLELCPRQIAGGAQPARLAGARREDSDLLEWSAHQGSRRRGASTQSPGFH
jgi:uncharacterized protein YyaL (SSP411 family)